MLEAWSGERQAFFDLESAWERAAAGRTISRTIGVGRYRIELQFAGPALYEPMFRPFAHVETSGEPDVVLRCWDSRSTGVPLPDSVDAGEVHVQSLPGRQRDLDRRWAIVRPDPGLSAYSRSASRGVYWWHDARALTYGDLAGGLRAMLNWSMADRGLHFLHTAAVGAAGRAALIVGQSGSGKSSTALTCLLAGMDYLGDDHCLVDPGTEPMVHAVYAAAKLHTEQMRRFPELEPFIVNPDREAIEKGVAILHPHFSKQLPRSLPIAALLVPVIGETTETRIEPLSRGAALLALAPSTLLQMAAADTSGLGPMGELVRRVPCYRVTLGSDRTAIAAAIGNLLVQGARAP
jgi:hypothetical protein